MKAETEEILHRVVEKAANLRVSRFVKSLIESSYKISFHQDSINVTKPDNEARDAFILTFRFFIVSNERTSFRSLAKLLDDSEISDQWKEAFRNLRSAINEYLDLAYGEYQYGGATHRFTNRQIMDTFLNGGLVHANDPSAVARYSEWTNYPGIMALLEMWFITTLQTLLRAIFFLATICEAELDGKVHGI
ncbi:MAG: hypothetical protein MUO64_11035 [Anaerolineales bacterium]|nr:hypothetical protein [Anaerolineales bacterium]